MKVWKLISGVLSLLMSLLVFLPFRIAGDGTILWKTPPGTAGILVAGLLLVGGIVSIATRRGGGGLALLLLFGPAAIVGFSIAGSYGALMFCSFWSLICTFLAAIDMAVNWNDQLESETRHDPEPPPAPGRTVSIPLKTVILEKDPARRNAMIDILPEKEAKSYLKKTLGVLINRTALSPADDDDDALKTLLNVLFGLIGFLILGISLYFALTAIADRAGQVPAQGTESSAVQTALASTDCRYSSAYPQAVCAPLERGTGNIQEL